MSSKTNFPFKKSLVKNIKGVRVYAGRGFDLANGKGFFVHAINTDASGFGFSKLNLLQAVRIALKEYYKDKLFWNNYKREFRKKLERFS